MIALEVRILLFELKVLRRATLWLLLLLAFRNAHRLF